jgi:hypothetical protein
MAKGQMRSTKEPRKPKADKKAKAATAAAGKPAPMKMPEVSGKGGKKG